MKSWLRQHQYAFRVAVIRLLTQPFSSLTNITVVALALSLPLIGWAILLSAQPVVQQIPVATEITVYLRSDLSSQQVKEVEQQIFEQHKNHIDHITKIDKNQALAELSQNPSWATALSVLPNNPLPDALVLRLTNTSEQSETAGLVANAIQSIPEVDQVQLDRDWLKRLEALLAFGRIALLILSLSVGIIMIATVFNTIRLQALNQRQEIAVARLVGATESFVRRPFLYVGAITGGLSCLFAIVLSRIALNPLNSALNRLAISYDTQLTLSLPNAGDLVVITFLIMIIAAMAARWSVTRHSAF